MKLNAALIMFLKGLCMGTADIIPGISGGTIALITGIYERLLRSRGPFFSLSAYPCLAIASSTP